MLRIAGCALHNRIGMNPRRQALRRHGEFGDVLGYHAFVDQARSDYCRSGVRLLTYKRSQGEGNRCWMPFSIQHSAKKNASISCSTNEKESHTKALRHDLIWHRPWVSKLVDWPVRKAPLHPNGTPGRDVSTMSAPENSLVFLCSRLFQRAAVPVDLDSGVGFVGNLATVCLYSSVLPA